MMLNPLHRLLSKDMAVDLGTATTLVYVPGRGIVLTEPSVVTIERDDQRVLAVGTEAKKMLGRTPENILALKPMRDGVIANLEVTESIIRYLIMRVHNRSMLVRPRILMCVPTGNTQVERRAVKDSALSAGAREVLLVEEPVAAAIGVGLPINEPSGNMVVDIGGGTTEIAVLSMGGIVYSNSIRVAGDEMDEAIVNYIRRKYNLLIGEVTGEKIKMRIGSAYPMNERKTMEVKGRDLVSGIPKTISINDAEVREALFEPILAIVDAIKSALEHTPPELAADVMDKGIMLSGGGSLLWGLDALLREETNLPIISAEDPVCAVVLGTGKLLENGALLKHLVA